VINVNCHLLVNEVMMRGLGFLAIVDLVMAWQPKPIPALSTLAMLFITHTCIKCKDEMFTLLSSMDPQHAQPKSYQINTIPSAEIRFVD